MMFLTKEEMKMQTSALQPHSVIQGGNVCMDSFVKPASPSLFVDLVLK